MSPKNYSPLLANGWTCSGLLPTYTLSIVARAGSSIYAIASFRETLILAPQDQWPQFLLLDCKIC